MDRETALEMEALAAQDRFRLALAHNVATNGRWFCALLVLINLAASNRALAVLAALPVGISTLLDPLPEGRTKALSSLVLYAFTAMVASATLVNAW